jgi:hypothetical protein
VPTGHAQQRPALSYFTPSFLTYLAGSIKYADDDDDEDHQISAGVAFQCE